MHLEGAMSGPPLIPNEFEGKQGANRNICARGTTAGGNYCVVVSGRLRP